MGIIAKQSFYNSVSIALAFLIGAFNTVYLYPTYMGSSLQGLVVALLALSNLVQPFISFGVQHAVIKFFSSCETKEEKDKLLSFSLLFPLIVFIILLIITFFFHHQITDFIATENEEMGKYAYLILAVAFSTALFEVFYNWLRIQLYSVFGNFLKEFFPRALIFTLLLIYAFGGLDLDGFIMALILGYYLRLLLVVVYSLIKYTPKFSFALPLQFKSILRYSLLIFMSGTAASLILDIDKSMISNILTVENVAYYSVAIFIAAVIEFPGRAMFQIISPLVAKALNDEDDPTLLKLLKKSANNLLLISGLLFLLINLNLNDFYAWVNLGDYTVALEVVFIVSIGKLFTMSLGCLNNIITNSKYYAYVFWFSTTSAVLAVVLNLYLIQWYGIIGAAYATLMVIVLINFLKILLVQLRFKINPYSKKTFLTLGIILILYLTISEISFEFDPFVSLVLRSVLITAAFSLLAYLLKLTIDLQQFFSKILPFIKRG
ncbi:MAG: oligosaccharide flippase family protein [Flavobacteriaceae bacterium]|jgi:O-antigen/teichoic acid export membrane protein|nr:oligosaccharide flippase family protein [Flavobacteriaceae bacterium]MDB2314667.1 oligosaccharide flippase family protein [Flavobacteriaceae bacterium]MDB2521218.1 oligosaccharide flippase family protein [Flavobacteriaceae bacterium]MDC3238986.1 oligosaccharide flippase family protein [Flavobacteriaceae bacterium]